jgi:hypothetical protein
MTSVIFRRAALALLLVAGALLPATDWISPQPPRPDPERVALERFVRGLEPTTRPGEMVALAVPKSTADDGYLRYRAQYLLPGRHVTLGDDRRASLTATFPSGAIRRP